ncbi:MAG: 1-deoxy-D-xylulose-5-phosphate reductoisomerase [Endomicrobiaceae bacterium]|nr:1-deoxy-D-xylulose-5-phosphate reductoisomerase [Endomicrobiaceae bacterium]
MNVKRSTIMKNIAILGSSGSIGIQTLDFISKTKNMFNVCGLSVNSNIELLKKQIIKFKPAIVSVGTQEDAKVLKLWCKNKRLTIKVFYGIDGLTKVATFNKVDTVLFAIVGAIGIHPLLDAIDNGKNIAIANKEALVTAGHILMKRAKEKNVKILPVDSEHSAIFQCIGQEKKDSIKRIILTASGGPFYKSNKNFSKITVEDALAHPTWKMGKKITIDSATLMNKGLEAIEASVLFDIPIEKIDIAIHPQSIVHSMVEFNDGCVMAQLSNPDMTLPIQYALSYPQRTNCYIKPLDLTEVSKLEFFKPNFKKFKCLEIAYNCAKIGWTMPAVMNGANEIAVKYFLNKQISFDSIPNVITKVITKHKLLKTNDIQKYIDSDNWARLEAEKIINSLDFKKNT